MQLHSYSAYALWIARVLASHKGSMTKLQLADRLGIDDGFAQQVLRRLQGAGLVGSVRGKKGGYLLAKDPRRITQREVIEASLERKICESEKTDHPLLKVARERMRETLTAALDQSILKWEMPPEFDD
jgi:Rrf2 family transcriptional regulator, cysteine metabolism repressor